MLRLTAVISLILWISEASASSEDDNGFASVCHPVQKSLDLLFLLDGSGSVGGSTFDTQKNMVQRIIEQIDISVNKTQVAILQYSSYTKEEFQFDRYQSKAEIQDALSQTHYIGGTTKTGKAIVKAQQMFSLDKGARVTRNDVAKVVVLVSDGHSQDEVIAPAKLLRESGVTLLALGIGEYVNWDGLMEITEDATKTFVNDSVTQFVETFRKLAIGDVCNYAKGARGAEIICTEDGIAVDILTKNPFKGQMYIQGYAHKTECSATAKAGSDGREVSLRVPLVKCGLQQQFMLKPRGVLIESTVMVQFHSTFNSKADKAFKIHCFFPENPPPKKDSNDTQAIETPTAKLGNVRAKLPCSYTLHKDDTDGCLLKNGKVGERMFHRFECDKETMGKNVGMLIHSCLHTDGQGRETLVIDEKGCGVDPAIVPSPRYTKRLLATMDSPMVKYPDNQNVQYRCSVRFCNRKRGECKGITPPQCPDSNNNATVAVTLPSLTLTGFRVNTTAEAPPAIRSKTAGIRERRHVRLARNPDTIGDAAAVVATHFQDRSRGQVVNVPVLNADGDPEKIPGVAANPPSQGNPDVPPPTLGAPINFGADATTTDSIFTARPFRNGLFKPKSPAPPVEPNVIVTPIVDLIDVGKISSKSPQNRSSSAVQIGPDSIRIEPVLNSGSNASEKANKLLSTAAPSDETTSQTTHKRRRTTTSPSSSSSSDTTAAQLTSSSSDSSSSRVEPVFFPNDPSTVRGTMGSTVPTRRFNPSDGQIVTDYSAPQKHHSLPAESTATPTVSQSQQSQSQQSGRTTNAKPSSSTESPKIEQNSAENENEKDVGSGGDLGPTADQLQFDRLDLHSQLIFVSDIQDEEPYDGPGLKFCKPQASESAKIN